MDKESDKKVKKYFSSKKLIIAAVFFLLAVGAGVGSAVKVNRDLTNSLSEIKNTSSSAEKSTQNAANEITGITVERTERESESITVVKDEDFVFPTGKEILKDYSNFVAVKSKTMNDWRVHNAIDFKAKAGQEVKAMQSGAVLAVYNSSLWGTIVEIDHGAGITARYCGLSENCGVSANDVVEQGDVIGTVADIPIEAADGTHLHLEMTKDGKSCDPLEMLSD